MKTPTVITDRDEYQKIISEASQTLYDVAKTAYGPAAGNVVLGFKHGAPMLSRDGVTNIKQVRSENPFEDDVIQAIKQVSEKNNQKVGDGTTAVVILAHHLLIAAQRLEGKGYNPMEIARMLKQAEQVAIKYINSIKEPTTDNFLDKVATISAGNPELGAMIADVMREVGKDGGVIIEQYEGLGVHNELIDGFYFNKGYKDTELINDPALNQSNHYEVPILVSSKVFNTRVDIDPILNTIHQSGFKELVIIGEVNNEALEVLKIVKASGKMIVVCVDPPYMVGGRTLFLDDISLMIGATTYNGVDFKPEEHIGNAKEVIITEHATTILEGDGEKKDIKERISSLRKQLKEEEHPGSIQFIKDRLARLTNKMAIIRVGGAIEFERDETKLRVQDSVCAVQSAMKDGILPGGGTTLARIEGTDFDEAFKEPFKQLMENAGLNPATYLAKLQSSEGWMGFNLNNLSDEVVDLLDEGVIDASLVIREVVTNAVSIVAGLITASAAISHPEKE